MEKTHDRDDAKSEAADAAHVEHVKALAALQERLDAATEARDLASDSHKAALEGWSQKRKAYADLQDMQMRVDEEAIAQKNILKNIKRFSLTLEKQVDESPGGEGQRRGVARGGDEQEDRGG